MYMPASFVSALVIFIFPFFISKGLSPGLKPPTLSQTINALPATVLKQLKVAEDFSFTINEEGSTLIPGALIAPVASSLGRSFSSPPLPSLTLDPP